MLFGHPLPGSAGDEEAPLKIGVLAVRGSQQCLESWSPTAGYLTRHVTGHRFVIVPLAHDEINPRVQKAEVDFILTNSAFYVGLEYWFRASRYCHSERAPRRWRIYDIRRGDLLPQ